MKLLLLFLLLIIGMVYIKRQRSVLLDRFVLIFMGLTWVIMIGKPKLTNDVALFFGVSRGEDLIVYWMISGIGYILLHWYIRLRKLDRQITELTRTVSIMQALIKMNADNSEISLDNTSDKTTKSH